MNTVVANTVQDRILGDREDVSASIENKIRPGEFMKALRFYGKEDVRVEDVPVPAVTDPRDVVVKITGTTVCGSDLHLYHREIPQLKKGDILGHEWMGVVDEVGPEVKTLKKGDRVVSSFQIACGDCKFCKEGLTSMCDTTNPSKIQSKLYGQNFAGIYGYSHFAGGYAGGQAEYCRAPHADVNLLKIPDGVPDEKALYLSDIVPTSYHAVLCADVDKDKTVAIWGLGPIGLLCAQWCKLIGARRIICIDNVPERLTFAETKLGCEVINFSDTKDVVARIQELEQTGVDCAIDATAFRYAKSILHTVQRAVGLETDSSDIINECIRAVRKFGTISVVADYAAYTNQFLIGGVMEKGITFRGTGQTPVQRYWHKLLEAIESGDFDPTIILSHRFKVDEFRELYEAFDKKEMGIMKVFVETKFSSPPSPGMPELSSFKEGNVKPSRALA